MANLPYGVNQGGRTQGPRDGNRKRNTMANMLSKNKVNYSNPGGAAALPPMDPSQTASYYQQLAALGAEARLASAQLRTERVGLRSAFGAQRAGINLDRKRGIADVEAQMSDRGLTGSSIAMTGMTDVRAAAATALQEAKSGLLQALAGNRLQQQGVGLNYFQEVTGLQSQALAGQQMALADQLAQNTIISGQETQMDILKELYQNQLKAGRGRRPGTLPPGKTGGRMQLSGSQLAALKGA